MDTTEKLASMGVAKMRARLKSGLWTVRVWGAHRVNAIGNPFAEFDVALRSAITLLRWAEINAGLREPRTQQQVAADYALDRGTGERTW